MTAQLSLTMIVRDEESTLGRVLGQAATFCDEMVIVDTGSRDHTPEVARQAGARVLDFVWIDDFSAARNASLNACRGDWVLWLDADDVVTPDVQAAILGAKREILTGNLDAITTPYRYSFAAETGECTFSFHRSRLARRIPELRWIGTVHEVLMVPGSRVLHREDLYIEHHPDPTKRESKSNRNLRIVERAVQAGDRSSRTLYYYACELRDAGRDADALEMYAAYLAAEAPTSGFVSPPDYTWRPWDYMSVCLANLGRHEESIAATICSLKAGNPERERLRSNLYWSVGQLSLT